MGIINKAAITLTPSRVSHHNRRHYQGSARRPARGRHPLGPGRVPAGRSGPRPLPAAANALTASEFELTLRTDLAVGTAGGGLIVGWKAGMIRGFRGGRGGRHWLTECM